MDAETYEPLQLRPLCDQCTKAPPIYRISTLEGIATAAANFTISARAGSERVATFDSSREEISVDAASAFLGRRALWDGPRVGDLELVDVSAIEASSHSAVPASAENEIRRSRGLRFAYGGASRTAGTSGRATAYRFRSRPTIARSWRLQLQQCRSRPAADAGTCCCGFGWQSRIGARSPPTSGSGSCATTSCSSRSRRRRAHSS